MNSRSGNDCEQSIARAIARSGRGIERHERGLRVELFRGLFDIERLTVQIRLHANRLRQLPVPHTVDPGAGALALEVPDAFDDLFALIAPRCSLRAIALRVLFATAHAC